MKIALVSTPFVSVPPRDYGGTELIVSELAEGLAQHGHEVTLFATGDSRSSARLTHLYPQAQWPPDPLTEIDHASWALACVGAEGGYDLVHLNTAGALAVAQHFLPAVPLVYTLHHPRVDTLSRFYRRFPDVWYVTISERQYALETPLPRVKTIHHGLDPAPYGGPIQPDDFVFFIGRLSDFKGPHVAIDAAARAGLPIRLAGAMHSDDDDPGFSRRELLPRLQQPHVSYLGPVGMERKTTLLRGARALLMPIDWEEPFGLVMIEAMLAGCPVVAFPRGSVPELVEPGVTGFVVDDEDDMVHVIRPGGPLDAFDRTRCRQRARERFGRMHMVREYEDYYGEACERTGTRRRRSATPVEATGDSRRS